MLIYSCQHRKISVEHLITTSNEIYVDLEYLRICVEKSISLFYKMEQNLKIPPFFCLSSFVTLIAPEPACGALESLSKTNSQVRKRRNVKIIEKIIQIDIWTLSSIYIITGNANVVIFIKLNELTQLEEETTEQKVNLI